MRNSFNKIFFSALLIVWSIAYSQNSIDYNKIRDQIVIDDCSINDIDTVDLTLKNLLTIDTLKIKKGQDNYFYDLAMTYYKKGFMYDQEEYRPLTVSTFLNCIRLNPKRGDAYYNLALIYFIYKNYSEAKTMLIAYKKYTKKKFWDTEMIDRIEKS